MPSPHLRGWFRVICLALAVLLLGAPLAGAQRPRPDRAIRPPSARQPAPSAPTVASQPFVARLDQTATLGVTGAWIDLPAEHLPWDAQVAGVELKVTLVEVGNAGPLPDPAFDADLQATLYPPVGSSYQAALSLIDQDERVGRTDELDHTLDELPAQGTWRLHLAPTSGVLMGQRLAVSLNLHYISDETVVPTVVQGSPGTPAVEMLPDGVRTLMSRRSSLAATWQLVHEEGFEGGLPDEWLRIDESDDDGGEYLWGVDDTRAYEGDLSVWPAAAGADGVDPATHNYPHNVRTWLIYGPIDLSQAVNAQTTFALWRELEDYPFDYVSFGVFGETDNRSMGVKWFGSSDWEELTVDFSEWAGREQVWIGWVFDSDYSISLAGAWVDAIETRLTHEIECYLDAAPVVLNGHRPQATAPEPPAPYTLQLQNERFVPAPGVEARLRTKALSVTKPEARAHVLLQLDEIPTAAERERLAERGVTLLRYIPDRAWIAAVPAGSIASLAATGSVRWLGAWDAPRKLHPALQRGDLGPWSYSPDEDRLALIVQVMPDVPLTDGEALVVAHGGVVQDAIKSTHSLVVWLPTDALKGLATEDAIEWIEQAPPPLEATNDCVRPRLGVDVLRSPVYDLDGSGIDILIYDDGVVAPDHPAFAGRLTIGDGANVSDHSTHVAGTAAGDGTGSPAHRDLGGMAPAAHVISYGFQWDGHGTFFYANPGDIEDDWRVAKQTHGADIGSASLGSNVARNGLACDLEGNYGAASQLMDAIVTGSLGEPYIATWAAGNERGNGACGTAYGTTAPPAGAKNPIHVGATHSDTDEMTYFSSWGPTDDGRLKPLITAPGCESQGEGFIHSTLPDGYGRSGYCGTSMATPAVAGVLALMLEQFRDQYGTTGEFLPATARAILMQTAVDGGHPGPDFQNGYGRVDAVAAVDAVRNGDFREGRMTDQGDSHILALQVEGYHTEVRISLAWDDAPAALAASTQLVNDLDLDVIAPDGTIIYPWVLDPAHPDHLATTGVDRLNNQEQISLIEPEEGTWLVRVTASQLPEGPQSYALAFPGAANAGQVAGLDDYEPDDTAAAAGYIATTGLSQRHGFHFAGDIDWLKVYCVTDGNYVFSTSNLDANADTVLTLYHRNGSTVLAEDDNGGSGLASRIEWRCPGTGTYYLRIAPANPGAAGPGSEYDISVEHLVAAGERPLRARAAHMADLDGDGRLDPIVWRPPDGMWWGLHSSHNYGSSGIQHAEWGVKGDVPLIGEVDGDGRSDYVIWRPGTGDWWMLLSTENYRRYRRIAWGEQGDIPLCADLDGDARSELIVWRPTTGHWWILFSRHDYAYSAYRRVSWGAQGDTPLSGDIDGDGLGELIVWRPSTGHWWIIYGGHNYDSRAYRRVRWGQEGDMPLIGDHDGDGRDDLVVWRPSTGDWWTLYEDGYGRQSWGVDGDWPLLSDYDGDGASDLVIWRPNGGVWWILYGNDHRALEWGVNGDLPLP